MHTSQPGRLTLRLLHVRLALVLAVASFLSLACRPGTPPTPGREEAQQIRATPDRTDAIQRNLNYYLGRWEAEAKIFDRDGNVASEQSYQFGEEVVIDGHLNLHTSYNADGTENKAFRFYSHNEDKFYLVDVTWKGDLWAVSGDGEYRGDRMTSLERALPDGRKVMLRFNHTNMQPDSFEATAELSFDGGNTWNTQTRATYRRLGEDAEGRAAFEKMASYLANGTGRWRAPNDRHEPSDPRSPEALGLWFERTAHGHALELTVVAHFADEVRPSSRSTWFWHPVKRKIIYQQISPNGAIRTGTAAFVNETTFGTLTTAIGPDGATSMNRGEKIMLSRRSHRTVEYVKGPAGEWVEQRALTWELQGEG